MASGPITWDQETIERVTDFTFFGSKITVEGDCRPEIKRHSLEEKLLTNAESVLKSRGITLLTKVHLVKAIVFPVVMYRCESWTIKKAEFRKTVTVTLYAREQKRHRCIEQSFGLCGRGRGWDDGIETCIISYKK